MLDTGVGASLLLLLSSLGSTVSSPTVLSTVLAALLAVTLLVQACARKARAKPPFVPAAAPKRKKPIRYRKCTVDSEDEHSAPRGKRKFWQKRKRGSNTGQDTKTAILAETQKEILSPPEKTAQAPTENTTQQVLSPTSTEKEKAVPGGELVLSPANDKTDRPPPSVSEKKVTDEDNTIDQVRTQSYGATGTMKKRQADQSGDQTDREPSGVCIPDAMIPDAAPPPKEEKKVSKKKERKKRSVNRGPKKTSRKKKSKNRPRSRKRKSKKESYSEDSEEFSARDKSELDWPIDSDIREADDKPAASENETAPPPAAEDNEKKEEPGTKTTKTAPTQLFEPE